MQGLELARKYFETYGINMLQEQFSDVKDRIAVGLVGEGSECLGFDDELSRDHDFEPGFCMWITREDEREFGFKLARAYDKLPDNFLGYNRINRSFSGANRHGVIVIGDFYERFLGTPHAPKTLEHWLSCDSALLRTASNGEVWCDKLGVFSDVRNELLRGFPEDVRMKKIAAHTAIMAQSGQYNLKRAQTRNEQGTVQLCVAEFVRHAISAVYLLNCTYEPFYKWAYRGMRKLAVLGNLEEKLTALNSAADKMSLINEISAEFSRAFSTQGLTNADGNSLSVHAFSMMNKIKDPNIRNMHVMDGI